MLFHYQQLYTSYFFSRFREPYLVTAPQTARPGFNFSLVVDLFVDRSVELRARMYSYRENYYQTFEQNIVTASGSYVKGGHLSNKTDLTNADYCRYYVHKDILGEFKEDYAC